MDGLFLVDKPSGPTSFDVVRLVRRAAKTRKVGHSGTLDPLASGLLVVAVGQGTKLIPYLMDTRKRYIAHIALGAATNTDDCLGEVISSKPIPPLGETSISDIFARFIGHIKQVPPVYSALKSGGEPLYRKARRGEAVTPPERDVHIEAIELIEHWENGFAIDVACGKGTYIRSLARDMGIALGTVGHIQKLRRLETSGFEVGSALSLEKIETFGEKQQLGMHVVPLAQALPGMQKVHISTKDRDRIVKGQAIDDNTSPEKRFQETALLSPEGTLVAVAKREGGMLKPVRVFSCH